MAEHLLDEALRLCHMEAAREEWDSDEIWQPLVKVVEPFHPTDDQWEQLCGYILREDELTVRAICAEIVEGGKHGRR